MNAYLKVMCSAAIALLFASGCGKKESALPQIRIQDIPETEDLTSAVRVDRLVVLEETDDGLLMHPDKAFVLSDGSMVFKDMGSRVLKFSADGTFAGTIGIKGRGPQEYNICRDIALSRDGKELSMLDLGYILTYDALDGHFLRKIEIPHHNYDEFCCGPDGGFYLFSAGPDTEDYTKLQEHDVFTLISSDGEPVLQTLPRKDYIMNVSLFTRSCKGTTYLRPLEGENFLYEVSGEDVSPVLSVDFGSLQSPSGYLANNGAMDVPKYIMSKSFHALVYDLESMLAKEDKDLNPLDRVIMQEVRKQNVQANGNPVVAKFSYQSR